jgi:hypothetical protein
VTRARDPAAKRAQRACARDAQAIGQVRKRHGLRGSELQRGEREDCGEREHGGKVRPALPLAVRRSIINFKFSSWLCQ